MGKLGRGKQGNVKDHIFIPAIVWDVVSSGVKENILLAMKKIKPGRYAMKFIALAMVLMLSSSLFALENNVEIHFNDGEDIIYVGQTNRFEVWIENTDVLSLFQLCFEFTDYGGDMIWDAIYLLQLENDAVDSVTLSFASHGLNDGLMPDTILVLVV